MVREALTAERLSALPPRDAAAYFIARRAEGLTPSERALFEHWLALDEAHRDAFDSADRAWSSFADAEGDEIVAAMRAHAKGARPPSLSARWRPVAFVAGIAASAAAMVLFIPGLNPWAPPRAEIQYASARGEVRELSLPDGSSMTLDAESTAVGRFDTHNRTVELQRGRAYFTVAPRQSRPFAVTAAGRRIVAVGTQFDVNIVADTLTVTLAEGHVRVGATTLEPGQQYVERNGAATVRTLGAAGENALAWRTGLISFDQQSLAEAVAVMNRYSSHDIIVIRDPGVAAISVSGQFRAGDAGRFADTLAEAYHLRAVRRADQIELVRAE